MSTTAEFVPVGEVARGFMQDSPIRSSQTMGKLAGALASAQAEFPAISKERTANVQSRKGEESSYSYAYADLADVLSAVRPHLAKNGLAIMQPMTWDVSPRLITRLVHSSGEWIESEYRLAEYERPQDMGSAITYARRYALTALLGIAAEEDDDGARAQHGQQRTKKAMPSCPNCGTPDRVIVSKFGGGFYCHSCKGKFIDRTEASDEPSQAEASPVTEGTSTTRTVSDSDDSDWPNDPDAHERQGVEPAKPAPKAAPRKAPAGDSPACPHCQSAGRVKPSRYPKPGGTHFCSACSAAFEPGMAL